MKKATVIAVISIALAVGCVVLVFALPITRYYFQNRANVKSTLLTFQLDSVEWANNTLMDWGDVQKGATYTKTFTAHNAGTNAANVYLMSSLPAGWSMFWAQNGTLLTPDATASGDLQMTTAADASEGVSFWDVWVNAQTA
jgi:hypothetical protein